MRVYYAAEGAFYAASVGMLLLWEERRRDFAVMMLHHLTTCGLIAASYSMRCAACMVCVMWRRTAPGAARIRFPSYYSGIRQVTSFPALKTICELSCTQVISQQQLMVQLRRACPG